MGVWYLVTSQRDQLILYYELHCVYNAEFLQKERANIVITPVIKQLQPVQLLTLMSGQENAVQFAKMLQAKYFLNLVIYSKPCLCKRTFIITMRNGDLESKGFLARHFVKRAPRDTNVRTGSGVPLAISRASNVHNV
ncbi:hypothetical protein GIB67_036304 [Kingdonia uniflora]|uniref:Uncharacterized protein n=1 Tax=Kingdonia uniflora TaxID=39325 RepID=A0A7J7L3U6_9MAGN|nr:hypothetical protein GIB67_036304 [Kingdonia uniflora]